MSIYLGTNLLSSSSIDSSNIIGTINTSTESIVINQSHLPDISITDVEVFASIALRNASTNTWHKGDIAVITGDPVSSYIFVGTDGDNNGTVDGDWQILNTPSAIPVATQSIIGGVKIGYTENDKNYPLELDSDMEAFVNVPWENTTYGAATTTIPGLIELEDDAVQTVAANAVSDTASRSYGLQVNSDGQGVVNVPWTDTVITNNTGSTHIPYWDGDSFESSTIEQLNSTNVRITGGLRVNTGTTDGVDNDITFQLLDGDQGSFRVLDLNGASMFTVSDGPSGGSPTASLGSSGANYDMQTTIHGPLTVGTAAKNRNLTVTGATTLNTGLTGYLRADAGVVSMAATPSSGVSGTASFFPIFDSSTDGVGDSAMSQQENSGSAEVTTVRIGSTTGQEYSGFALLSNDSDRTTIHIPVNNLAFPLNGGRAFVTVPGDSTVYGPFEYRTWRNGDTDGGLFAGDESFFTGSGAYTGDFVRFRIGTSDSQRTAVMAALTAAADTTTLTLGGNDNVNLGFHTGTGQGQFGIQLFGDINVDTNLTTSGDLEAAGDATLSGNTNLGGTLTVTGNTTLDTGLTGYLRADAGVVSMAADPSGGVSGTAGTIPIFDSSADGVGNSLISQDQVAIDRTLSATPTTNGTQINLSFNAGTLVPENSTVTSNSITLTVFVDISADATSVSLFANSAADAATFVSGLILASPLTFLQPVEIELGATVNIGPIQFDTQGNITGTNFNGIDLITETQNGDGTTNSIGINNGGISLSTNGQFDSMNLNAGNRSPIRLTTSATGTDDGGDLTLTTTAVNGQAGNIVIQSTETGSGVAGSINLTAPATTVTGDFTATGTTTLNTGLDGVLLATAGVVSEAPITVGTSPGTPINLTVSGNSWIYLNSDTTIDSPGNDFTVFPDGATVTLTQGATSIDRVVASTTNQSITFTAAAGGFLTGNDLTLTATPDITATTVAGSLTATNYTGPINNINPVAGTAGIAQAFQIWAGTQSEFDAQFSNDGSGTDPGTVPAVTDGSVIYIITNN